MHLFIHKTSPREGMCNFNFGISILSIDELTRNEFHHLRFLAKNKFNNCVSVSTKGSGVVTNLGLRGQNVVQSSDFGSSRPGLQTSDGKSILPAPFRELVAFFLFLIHGFFLALKLAGVRGPKQKRTTLSTREGTDFYL